MNILFIGMHKYILNEKLQVKKKVYKNSHFRSWHEIDRNEKFNDLKYFLCGMTRNELQCIGAVSDL